MLNWVKPFSIFLFLDSNGYDDQYGRYECLMAYGAEEHVNHLDGVHTMHGRINDWLFGHICYDYKNVLEQKLSSRHTVRIGWENLYFFRPQVVCYINKEKTTLTIEALGISPDMIFEGICQATVDDETYLPELSFNRKIEHGAYIKTIDAIREHIRNGDCYEINICNEAYCKNADIDPYILYNALQQLSPAPFAAFYRNEDKYMVCSSPERYLVKYGNKLRSQPIKGTAPRGITIETDEENRLSLQHSEKDKAENVMIVDLVRNDLAHSCQVSTVTVDELFGIYSFPQVHQMISTVSGDIRHDVPFTDAIRYSFPMGSMTGAPKVKVMQLIDEYEQSRRELFSGTVGYITPGADFDFNVIIRSLFYNSSSQYLSYQTGGAITYDSTAQGEWEELLLKASALEKVFSKK